VTCAPVYSSYEGLSTRVAVSIGEGLKHESSVHCDELDSLAKTALPNFVGTLPSRKRDELTRALRVALDVDD
jgi:mRNA interferase MazF